MATVSSLPSHALSTPRICGTLTSFSTAALLVDDTASSKMRRQKLAAILKLLIWNANLMATVARGQRSAPHHVARPRPEHAHLRPMMTWMGWILHCVK
jgi:hypothetical protein